MWMEKLPSQQTQNEKFMGQIGAQTDGQHAAEVAQARQGHGGLL